MVQAKPGANLQLHRPGPHGFVGLAAAVFDHLDVAGVHAGDHLDALVVQIQIAHATLGHVLLQMRQAVGQLVQTFLRNGFRARHEGIGQGVAHRFDVLVLQAWRIAQQAHALTQALQQAGQLLDHARTVVAVRLGAGGPQQLRSHLFQRSGFLMLQAVLDAGHRQHLDPDLEQKFTHLVAHRHVVEQLAQLDGVLHRQGFLLLNLLRDRHKPAGAALPAEVGGEELLEFVVNELEHTPAGLRVLLDHLHDPLDFRLQRLGAHAGLKAHHTRAHAVDQAARGVLQGAEKLGLGERHAQHRNLQAGEPHPHARRNALFGQNALKHKSHDFNGGLLGGGAGRLFELHRALAQCGGRALDMAGIHEARLGA